MTPAAGAGAAVAAAAQREPLDCDPHAMQLLLPRPAGHLSNGLRHDLTNFNDSSSSFGLAWPGLACALKRRGVGLDLAVTGRLMLRSEIYLFP